MPGTRWKLVGVAIVAAVVVALLSPSRWPDGDRTVEVDVAGYEAEHETRQGNPTRVLVRARDEAGNLVRPDLGAVRVTLVLSDGTREIVPVLRWDETNRQYVAERRAPTDPALSFALLAAIVVLWVTEATPLWVSSLLVPIVLVGFGAQGAREALAPFFHPIIALFFGGFLMAESMRRVGLDRRAALLIVARFGRSPEALFAAMLGVSAFLSMWMSNTAATALLVPIALAVTEPLGHPGYRRAVVLGIAYAATLGGTGSAIGTPANPIAIEFLDAFVGHSISFVGWFAYGLPLVFLFLPVIGIYLWRRSGVHIDADEFRATRATAREELASLGPATRAEWTVLAVFAIVVALWLTQQLHGLNTGIVALIGATMLAVLGKLEEEDLGRISWSALLTFGGGLALGSFLVQSGTSDWVATRFGGLAGLPPIIGIAVTALLALGLTAVASNTATAAMLVPLAIPLAGILGVDAKTLVLVVAIASSIDFALVIGTPPTMIAYSTRLFSARDIFKMGIVLDLLGVVLLVTVVVGLWNVLGLL
ncbi:MAG: DASS family sodium-coupled anion symporter [Planctomycetota bacterium]